MINDRKKRDEILNLLLQQFDETQNTLIKEFGIKPEHKKLKSVQLERSVGNYLKYIETLLN